MRRRRSGKLGHLRFHGPAGLFSYVRMLTCRIQSGVGTWGENASEHGKPTEEWCWMGRDRPVGSNLREWRSGVVVSWKPDNVGRGKLQLRVLRMTVRRGHCPVCLLPPALVRSLPRKLYVGFKRRQGELRVLRRETEWGAGSGESARCVRRAGGRHRPMVRILRQPQRKQAANR